MKKRILSVVMASMVMGASLIGCGKVTTNLETEVPVEEEEATDEIAKEQIVEETEENEEDEETDVLENTETVLEEYTDKSYSNRNDMYDEKDERYFRDENDRWVIHHMITGKQSLTGNVVELYVLLQDEYFGLNLELPFFCTEGVFEYEDGTRVSSAEMCYKNSMFNGTEVEKLEGGTVYCFLFELEDGNYSFNGGVNSYMLGYDHSEPWEYDGEPYAEAISLKGRKATNLYLMYGNYDWAQENSAAYKEFADRNDTGISFDWVKQTYYQAAELKVDNSFASLDLEGEATDSTGLNYEGQIVFVSNNGDGTYVCNINGENKTLTISDDAVIKMISFSEKADDNYLITIPGSDFKTLEWGFDVTYDGAEVYNCSGDFTGYVKIVNGVIQSFTADFMS